MESLVPRGTGTLDVLLSYYSVQSCLFGWWVFVWWGCMHEEKCLKNEIFIQSWVCGGELLVGKNCVHVHGRRGRGCGSWSEGIRGICLVVSWLVSWLWFGRNCQSAVPATILQQEQCEGLASSTISQRRRVASNPVSSSQSSITSLYMSAVMSLPRRTRRARRTREKNGRKMSVS